MSGILYLVGTPIGNLSDFSPRGEECLRTVDFIAAEDTRVTLKLMNRFDIHKPLVSYYEHNRMSSGEKIIARLLAGENCALVTDAGMPAISDPGEDLVRLAAENKITVQTVPGPSACVTALAVSGLPTQRFCFEGFLAVSGKNRSEHLQSLRNEKRTMIFYEAPHKLLKTLQDMLAVFGDRPIALCRELTKLHEEIYRGTFSGALTLYETTPPRGEYVLVVHGAVEMPASIQTNEEILAEIDGYRKGGMSLRQACKVVSEHTGISKNELYAAALAVEPKA